MGRGSKGGVQCCLEQSSSSSESESSSSQEQIDITCLPCIEIDLPRYFKISISGVQNGTCSSCTDLNGDYIVEWDNFTCCWYTSFSGICIGSCSSASFNTITLRFLFGNKIEISIGNGHGCSLSACLGWSWEEVIIGKINCNNLNNRNIPLSAASIATKPRCSDGTFPNPCKGSDICIGTPTCLLTAL